ncbi:BglG family transcription antiterminator [Amphibacillus sp. Q70]|uniref:BglG family transcription antiterminator n=1 Tax=Amphibacillus sp. Q70 TaxID=3453416 RepID=UPI003F846D93
MLNKRQRVILAYILYTKPYLKGEPLAEIVHISHQTLQREINAINDEIKEFQVEIKISKKGHYFIPQKHEVQIVQYIAGLGAVDTSNTNHHMMWERINIILGILLFERDFISMEDLANKLYVSKSMINLHIKEINKVIYRTKGLDLTISKTKGIRLHGKEEAKRFLLSKIMLQGLDLKQIVPLFSEGDQLPYYNPKEIEIKIRKILVDQQVIISGRAFEIVISGIRVCIIRNYLGYKIPSTSSQPLSLLPLIKKIDEQLQQMEIYLSEQDLYFMEKAIIEQETFDDHARRNQEDIEMATLLIHHIEELTKLNLAKDRDFKDGLIFYLHQTHQRIYNGQAYTNFHKRQINRLFPMTAALMNHCKQAWLERVDYLPESELAYITLFIGRYIEAMEESLRLLLVSNENSVLINWFEKEIKRIAGSKVKITQVIPQYLYDETLDQQLEAMDVIVTTEMIEPMGIPIVYIHSLFTETEEFILEDQLNYLITDKEQEKLKRLQKDIIQSDSFYRLPKKLKTVEEGTRYMLEQANLGDVISQEDVLDSYISNDSKVGLFSIITTNSVHSTLLIGQLEKQLTFRTSPVKTIIIALYNIHDNKAVTFYQIVKHLLAQNQSGRSSKVKNYQELESLLY